MEDIWKQIGPVFEIAKGALGAGWPGLIATVLMGGVGFFALRRVIKDWNARRDQADQENAGADAGITAGDMAGQINEAGKALDSMEQALPPAKGE